VAFRWPPTIGLMLFIATVAKMGRCLSIRLSVRPIQAD
jgi:hypothetical protein